MLLKLWINKSIYFPSKINNKFSKLHPIYFFFISLVDWWIEYNILCRDDNLNTILLQQFGVLVKFVINMQWPKKWTIFFRGVVKVTQNWRNWGFWKLPIWGPNWHWFFQPGTRKSRRSNGGIRIPNCRINIFQKPIFWARFVPILWEILLL